jgi:WD40 repeat protein
VPKLGHSDNVYSVAFSPDGGRIVSGSGDNTVKLWDAASGALLRTFEGHSPVVWKVAFSPDGSRIVSGDPDDTLKLWDAASERAVRGDQDTAEQQSCLMLHRTRLTASAPAVNRLYIWCHSNSGDTSRHTLLHVVGIAHKARICCRIRSIFDSGAK